MSYRNTCLIVMFAVSLLSCSTKKIIEYRDRDVNHYINTFVHDTLVETKQDSVYVSVITKGDTVYLTKYKEKIQYRDKIVLTHDTCYKDSLVYQYVYNEKEVVKVPKICKISLVFSLLCIIFAIVKFILWRRAQG